MKTLETYDAKTKEIMTAVVKSSLKRQNIQINPTESLCEAIKYATEQFSPLLRLTIDQIIESIDRFVWSYFVESEEISDDDLDAALMFKAELRG